MKWQVAGNTITTPLGVRIKLELPVKEVVEIDDVLVVVLDVPPKAVMTENVFGFCEDGLLLWQIQPVPEVSQNPVNCYVGVSHLQPKLAALANWNGWVIDVEPKTGSVVGKRFLK